MFKSPDGSELLARFEPLLSSLDRSDLARSPDVICGVLADGLTIGYANAAWFEFARQNGARRVWGPGDCLLDAISDPIRGFYAEKLGQVLADRTPWEHDYECSSPDVHREFRLRALVLGEGAGLLLVHALRVEGPHADPGHPFVASRYRSAAGLITQCAHCRRVRCVATPSWDWVPALVAQPVENLTHGLCEACAAYYFGPDV